MKKIALVINDAYSWAGTENMCNFMATCFSEQHQVTVFSLRGEGTPFYPFHGVQQIISLQAEKNPWRSLVKRIRRQAFDDVFIISMGRLSVLFALHSLLSLKPCRARRFACEHVALASFSKPVRMLKSLALRYYHRVIVLTERDRQALAGRHLAAQTIPNPVVYKQYQRTQRHFQALAVGRLEAQKGFDRLLEIWQQFVVTHPHWRLTIAGDGELKSELMIQATWLNIIASVDFVGRVSNIEDYYRDSDVLLMTSRYEGMPLALLEAKSWSLPVIAWDCPTGPREIIAHRQDGVLVAMDDSAAFVAALQQLADDDEQFYAMSAATGITSRRFDAASIAQTWRELL